jgi:hypothetical protein
LVPTRTPLSIFFFHWRWPHSDTGTIAPSSISSDSPVTSCRTACLRVRMAQHARMAPPPRNAAVIYHPRRASRSRGLSFAR